MLTIANTQPGPASRDFVLGHADMKKIRQAATEAERLEIAKAAAAGHFEKIANLALEARAEMRAFAKLPREIRLYMAKSGRPIRAAKVLAEVDAVGASAALIKLRRSFTKYVTGGAFEPRREARQSEAS